jgi:hypothetical protein
LASYQLRGGPGAVAVSHRTLLHWAHDLQRSTGGGERGALLLSSGAGRAMGEAEQGRFHPDAENIGTACARSARTANPCTPPSRPSARAPGWAGARGRRLTPPRARRSAARRRARSARCCGGCRPPGRCRCHRGAACSRSNAEPHRSAPGTQGTQGTTWRTAGATPAPPATGAPQPAPALRRRTSARHLRRAQRARSIGSDIRSAPAPRGTQRTTLVGQPSTPGRGAPRAVTSPRCTKPRSGGGRRCQRATTQHHTAVPQASREATAPPQQRRCQRGTPLAATGPPLETQSPWEHVPDRLAPPRSDNTTLVSCIMGVGA